MHKNVLSDEQLKLLPLLTKFSNSFILVGGTAIALQLGHRRSIDFDLFSQKEFDSLHIRAALSVKNSIQRTLVDSQHELTVVVDGVKLTFYHYPYDLHSSVPLEDIIQMPDLRTLGAMKAFALGRRAKWKDYVDLYFIFQALGYAAVIDAAKALFESQFNEKLFRSQLSYFEDVDYSEQVEYLLDNPPPDQEIVHTLQEIGTA